MNTDYLAFIKSKTRLDAPSGFDLDHDSIGFGGLPLMEFQRHIVKWSLRRGRAAVFANTGLGKTAIQTTWAGHVNEHTGQPVLIAAPLCVARQTVSEAAKFGVHIQYVREMPADPQGAYVTNYEMLDEFDTDAFAGIVLDESSILKNRDGKTRKRIIDNWKRCPYRLSCTATPSPNDYVELGNQAEFLGIMGMDEMLAMFFTHDGGDTAKWRLKGHGRRKFWEWLASWAVTIRMPSDLGFSDDGYILPTLHTHEHLVSSEYGDDMFTSIAQSLTERRQAKKETVVERANKAAEIVLNSLCTEHKGMAANERFRREQEVHEGVLQEESREIQKDARATGGAQQEEKGSVCEGQGISGEDKAAVKRVLGQVSREEEKGPHPSQLRYVDGGLQGADGDTERGVCDLRPLRHERQEHIPAGRSLSQEREGSRASLSELQSSAREVQRLYLESYGGDGLPDKEQAPEPWLVWCHFNEEQRLLEKLFGDLCFSIYGSLSMEEKESRLKGWLAGERPVLISKPSVIGMGLNLQHCARMAFVGLDDSFEQMYQAVRRCWRFGQKREVHSHIVSAESLGAIKQNVERKERQMEDMQASMVEHMVGMMSRDVRSAGVEKTEYNPAIDMIIPDWIGRAA